MRIHQNNFRLVKVVIKNNRALALESLQIKKGSLLEWNQQANRLLTKERKKQNLPPSLLINKAKAASHRQHLKWPPSGKTWTMRSRTVQPRRWTDQRGYHLERVMPTSLRSHSVNQSTSSRSSSTSKLKTRSLVWDHPRDNPCTSHSPSPASTRHQERVQ